MADEIKDEEKQEDTIELGSGILDEVIIINGVIYEYQK